MIPYLTTEDSELYKDPQRDLRRQSAINSRQPFRQGHHVVDDGVTNIAVEVAQLALRFAIDRDAERRDAGNLRLAQSFARVFARVSCVAVVMIVRTAV